MPGLTMTQSQGIMARLLNLCDPFVCCLILVSLDHHYPISSISEIEPRVVKPRQMRRIDDLTMPQHPDSAIQDRQ